MKNEDKFYMNLAYSMANASVSERRKVGALLVKNNNIIAFGYNGTPSGFDNTCELPGGDTKPEVLHAESNAITKCAKSTNSSDGSILYVTCAPCFDCAKLIIQSGIKGVVFKERYRNDDGLKLLAKAGIKIKRIK